MKIHNTYLTLAFHLTSIYIMMTNLKCLQHHYEPLVFIVLVFIILYAVILITTGIHFIRKNKRKWDVYINHICERWFLLIGIVSMIVFWGHELIELTSSQTETLTITEADLQEIISASETAFIEENEILKQSLSEETYAAATDSKRLEIMALIAAQEAEYLGISLPTIHTASLADDIGGYYNDDENSLILNSNFLSHYECSITTVIHEMFHAYQYACIQENNGENNLLYMRTINTWRQEYEDIYNDFQSNEGLTAYYTQDSEESARKYAENRSELYFQYR